jgi:leucyl aminopeptidase
MKPFAVSFEKKPKIKADTVILPVFADKRLSPGAAAADRESRGLVKHALAGQNKFTGKAGQFMTVTVAKGGPCARYVLMGLGDAKKLDAVAYETAGGNLYMALEGAGAARATLRGEGLENEPESAAWIANGMALRAYGFDKYKTKKKKGESEAGFAVLEGVTANPAKAQAAYKTSSAVTKGVHLVRDFVNEPPNELYPDSFARMIAKELRPLGVKVDIYDHKQLEKMGFDAHLAVGMGSSRPPRAVVMRWQGKKSKEGPLAFVGKGVTFDTGGVDIKPADGMLDMKMDMAGAAVVAGLMKALAIRKAKVDVVCVAGLAENMPSHTAYRPSDIIGSRSGQTIEVLNTDAEGRLVLADALAYVQDTYKPRLIVDLATLTGAIMVALGYEYCGAFVNDDKLWAQLDKAGRATGEKLWRMPLDESYRREMDSPIADIKSIGNNGRLGGSCTAAAFLERFIGDGTPWAHLDIAGTAWLPRDRPLGPKPATGFGVRLLERFVADNYEG